MSPFLFFIGIFYIPYVFIYFLKEIKKIQSYKQIFIHGNDDYGANLEILNYVRCWIHARGSAALVVLSPKQRLVKELALYICPDVQVIAPKIIICNSMQRISSIFLKHFLYPKLFNYLIKKIPSAIYIYGVDFSGDPIYNEFIDKEIPKVNQVFNDAYVGFRKKININYPVLKDYYKISKDSPILDIKDNDINFIKAKLKINSDYVLLNINTKKYNDVFQNTRSIQDHTKYNVVIDNLILKGYQVILQGAKEQPYFDARLGFIDYAHSKYQNYKNDFLLYSACKFCISSKSGVDWYPLLFKKPLLGLNYTELSVMQPNPLFRFFPKFIKKKNGGYLNWNEYLSHPVYFQIGQLNFSKDKLEFIEMSEDDLLNALEEFIILIEGGVKEFNLLTGKQKEFKEQLEPFHQDLYYIDGLPCNSYLIKSM